MELHPILECGDSPSNGLWYVISSKNCPESRVGQACVARTREFSPNDELLVFGGANPSSTFNDVYSLDLTTLVWKKAKSEGFRSRYEHTAFIPSSYPNLVYIFGGANKSGNLDCLQVYDREKGIWNKVSDSGSSPSPRTIHCGASSGDKMFIWGGGKLGPDPVPDVRLHTFDAVTRCWSHHDLIGTIPSPRHGHVMTVISNTLYIHGGMAGTEMYDDLFAVNLNDYSCVKITQLGDKPCARAAHSGCSYQSMIYIFGGMCIGGALNDMYSFDTITMSWTTMKFDCPPPAPRLDYSMVCTLLPVKKELSVSTENPDKKSPALSRSPGENSSASNGPNIVPVDLWQGIVAGDQGIENLSLKDGSDGPRVEQTAQSNKGIDANLEEITKTCNEFTYVPICIVFGGMDTSGNLFNDVLLTAIGNKA